MREDWNSRAEEDAGYYVAFGRRDQDDEDFFATGAETAAGIALELRRLPADMRDRALELLKDEGELINILNKGADKAKLLASKTLHDAYQALGILG